MATYDASLTESWVSYEATWHTAMDERTCPKCMALEGQTWTFPKLEGPLIDPRFGAVYDLSNDLPLTHSNCRCFLEVRPVVEVENIESIKVLKSSLTEFGYMPSNIDEVRVQIQQLNDDIDDQLLTFREWERVGYRGMALMRRVSGSEDARQTIVAIQRLIMTIRMLTMSITFLEMATPYGWIMGLLGLGVTAGSVSDMFYSVGT